ncbi:tetratricopeptide-like helical [Trichoderma arundinaceum]|uniref:Tetratricopeptide-like helical n=1 Tax=Trichoderma arundinaceum TaxID=490622 RepID=A0A395NDL0_TRIAR|nr:tetratricopeptide-like helical [Trichoderma arundinaceum]
MSPDGDVSMEDAIGAGRDKYAAQRYRQALDFFTHAIKLCPCEIGKRKRKRSDSVSRELDQDAQSNQRLPTLECDNPLHLQALSYRAGTFEKIPDLRRALADAQRMTAIAPCAPEGYLRASKILRLDEKPADSLDVLTDGILVLLERDSSRIEDIRARPGHAQLWRSLIFTGASAPKRPLSFDATRKLLAHSMNDIKELVIDKAAKFGLDQRKFKAILDAGIRLERLELANPGEALFLTRIPKQLKHLRLDGLYRFYRPGPMDGTRDAYQHFLMSVAATLESLTLTGLPRRWFTSLAIPIMPRLKYLRLARGPDQSRPFPILQMLRNTPLLEQLYVEHLIVDSRLPGDEKFDSRCLPHLKCLTILNSRPRARDLEEDMDDESWIQTLGSTSARAYQKLITLHLTKKLKYLEILHDWEYSTPDTADDDIFKSLHTEGGDVFESLEGLRLSDLVMSPMDAQIFFRQPIMAGKLSTFDIVFPLPAFQENNGQSSAGHIQKYQWLEGLEAIRCIGLYNFSFKAYVRPWESPLIKFLQTFPCLEEVKFDSSVTRDYELQITIQDVLKLVKLKSIYATQLFGESFDKTRRLARERGVEFIWEEQPTKWPIRFKDD